MADLAVPIVSRDHPALVTAARHGLPVSSVSSPQPVIVDERDVDGVRLFSQGDRTSGLLAGAVHAGEIVIGSNGATPAQRDLVDGDWHDALRACVALEALLVRVAARLDSIGARWLVTKGPALAHLDYPDPALRTFADIDLIVHPGDWEAVLALLDPARVDRVRTDRFAMRYGKGATVVIDDMEVDLHLRFSIGRFGVRCRIGDCFECPDSVTVAGRAVPTPAVEYRLLHACYHATLGGNAELRAFRDVAQLALGSPTTIDRTWRIAKDWRVEAVVATAVLEAWRRLQLPQDHPVAVAAAGVAIGRADLKALAVFASEAGFRRQSMTSLSALPIRRRPGFLYSAWTMSRERHR